MLRISRVPFKKVDPELQKVMQQSDEALGGSAWIQVFAHTTDLYKPFVQFYYSHIMTDTDGVGVKLTELIRHKVAQINERQL